MGIKTLNYAKLTVKRDLNVKKMAFCTVLPKWIRCRGGYRIFPGGGGGRRPYFDEKKTRTFNFYQLFNYMSYSFCVKNPLDVNFNIYFKLFLKTSKIRGEILNIVCINPILFSLSSYSWALKNWLVWELFARVWAEISQGAVPEPENIFYSIEILYSYWLN